MFPREAKEITEEAHEKQRVLNHAKNAIIENSDKRVVTASAFMSSYFVKLFNNILTNAIKLLQ